MQTAMDTVMTAEHARREHIDLLFLNARTHYNWLDRPVPDALLREVYDVARMAPTSANGSPARIIFVKSPEAKDKLRPCLKPGNVDKTMTAPVTAILGYDLDFFEHFDRLAPFNKDIRGRYLADADLVQRAAFRNSTLQGAYLILAARALGLDCGPMSGFDHEAIDEAFFPSGRIKSNFLINLGYGNPEKLCPRQFRFPFEEVCTIL
jgi:3-hydroxypropanoate dehydrogenase